jgi:hypothetical protein
VQRGLLIIRRKYPDHVHDTRFSDSYCNEKGEEAMGAHTLDELMRKWQHEQLTSEQMIGQLLQHVSVLSERLRLVERRVGSLAEANQRHPATTTTKDKKAER